MHKTLGEALFAIGFTQTVWVNKDNINKHDVGSFNPNADWSGSFDKAKFNARYGAGAWDRKGDLVGERYARDVVEGVVRHPTNPLQILNNQQYVIAQQDDVDVKMVRGSGDAAIYDTFFLPLSNQLFPQQPPVDPGKPPVDPGKPPVDPGKPPVTPPLVVGKDTEYLSFWLGLSFGQAADIVASNLVIARRIFKDKSVAQVADLFIRNLTLVWRGIKQQHP
jgi:hypothetical protein